MSIFNHFKHLNLSQDQETALLKLEAFIDSTTPVFMLKGYAGSGKTTILKGLVEYLNTIEKDFALMAPTGRAAKVIREKTGYGAFTIHKTIYCYDELEEIADGNSFHYSFKIRNNLDVFKKIFIIDEASMLSDAKSETEFFQFGSSHLLSDLIYYTRVAEETANTKIIFVGDPCQLPPVTDDSSKAFDAGYLKNKFNLISAETEMREVKRQEGESEILKSASKIRKCISAKFYNDFNLKSNEKDIIAAKYDNFLETWEKASNPKIIIASKNKTCLDLNLQIRQKRFGNSELPMQKSDIVIMGGNNYRKGIFNGEFAVVNSVSELLTERTIYLKGKSPVTLYWRDVELVFPDTDSNNKIINGKMLENFLYGDNNLKPEEMQALYVDFAIRHKNLKPKSEEFNAALLRDEYFNCLKMKYGYAITCHKAQGGEWDNVFTIWDNDNEDNFNCYVDQQRKTGKTNQNFYRWAYTAITRASKTLYTLNPPFFNAYSSMAFLEENVINSLNEISGDRIEAEDITLDNELIQKLKQFNLLEQPIELQDHFIKIRHAVSKQYIEITNWENLNYEIRYTMKREQATAVFKTFFNGKLEFKKEIAPIHNLSIDPTFNNAITELLKRLPNIAVKRNTSETIISKIEFESEIEEKYPFTKSLFDNLMNSIGGTDIRVENIEHLTYRERYTFRRNNESIVLDFEYNNSGFFGRVVPILNKSNSPKLLLTVQNILKKLKHEEYAI